MRKIKSKEGQSSSYISYIGALLAGVFTGIVILPLLMWGESVLRINYFEYYDRCHPKEDRRLKFDEWTFPMLLILLGVVCALIVILWIGYKIIHLQNYRKYPNQAPPILPIVSPWNLFLLIPVIVFILVYASVPNEYLLPLTFRAPFPLTGWSAPVRNC